MPQLFEWLRELEYLSNEIYHRFWKVLTVVYNIQNVWVSESLGLNIYLVLHYIGEL
jgi:hypothetical protein